MIVGVIAKLIRRVFSQDGSSRRISLTLGMKRKVLGHFGQHTATSSEEEEEAELPPHQRVRSSTEPRRRGWSAAAAGKTTVTAPSAPFRVGGWKRARRQSSARGLSRVSAQPGRVVSPLLPDLNWLQAARVRQKTQQIYLRVLGLLATWLGVKALVAHDAPWWDLTLVRYLCWLAEEGYRRPTAVRTVSALLWGIPLLGRPALSVLPAASQVLRGWSALEPGRSRPPIPILLVRAIALRLAVRGDPLMGLCVLLSFECYLRPSEAMALRVFQVVLPLVGHATAASVTLLLHAQELEIPSKTGEWDVSVALELARQAYLEPMLRALVARRGRTELLWSFDYAQLHLAFMTAAKFLGAEELHPTLYGLRHGGASHDFAVGDRPLLAIQQRGAWRSFRSVMRYQKAGRLSLQLTRLGLQTRNQLSRMTAHFERDFTDAFWKRSGLRRAGSRSC